MKVEYQNIKNGKHVLSDFKCRGKMRIIFSNFIVLRIANFSYRVFIRCKRYYENNR